MFDWTPYVSGEMWGVILKIEGEDETEDHLYLQYAQRDYWLIGWMVHIFMRYMPPRVQL